MNNERFRPTYHYTPPRHFMNDPNGLTFRDGLFYVFHQYNPHGNAWGHMAWKQATSPNLIDWTHYPPALEEADGVMIFSGSAVVDAQNTAGFGENALVAVYTGHRDDGMESQCLGYSVDGRSWSKYDGNPVLGYEADFRDPKVLWHAETGRWVMVVVKANEKFARFYGSADLKAWELLSTFGPEGAPADSIPNWECPDLMRLPIDNRPGESAWVLHINVGDGAPAGGSGAQYFVGAFDGARFVNRNPADTVLWTEWGKDNYAAVSFSDTAGPGGEAYWLGWMCNWRYANVVPTDPWRNGFTLPRLLSLRETADGLRLAQRPIPQLEALRGERVSVGDIALSGRTELPVAGAALEIVATFEMGDAEEVGLGVLAGDGQGTRIGVDTRSRVLFVDRSRSGIACSDAFDGVHAAPLTSLKGNVTLRVFVDTASVEVFADDGLTVMTTLVFPDPESVGVFAFAHGGAARLVSLDAWPLRPAVNVEVG